MQSFRLTIRPVTCILAVLAPVWAAAQDTSSVQKLLERGALEEAVQRADGDGDNPESRYFAAQAAARMNNNGRAVEQYSRLQDNGDPVWKAIGESGARLIDGNVGEALAAAERAVASGGDNPFAHYQLGQVANRQNEYERANAAFERAAELKPDFAYAHYYAGTTSQRLKHIAKMSEHFERFIRLAPEAPERTAVAALLRTLRPRN